MYLRHLAREAWELGVRGTLFRLQWETTTRSGLAGQLRPKPPRLDATVALSAGAARRRLAFADPTAVADAMRDRVSREQIDQLLTTADDATHGRILCFDRWTADFGSPIEWRRNPVNGDVKLTWEVARFPHAYSIARAAAFVPTAAPRFASALTTQIESFIAENPVGHDVHWTSGQEVAVRLLAWLFASDVLLSRAAVASRAETLLPNALLEGAAYIEQNIDYARLAVYNNHLLLEALALFIVGGLFPDIGMGRRWWELGRSILDEQADRQFYKDGAYIQQSHNYHRVALQALLWACKAVTAVGGQPSAPWLRAMERSLDFLVSHQNPLDGRLPNYGANDGALPSILSTCDFSDFRPVLQAVSIVVRNERLYEPGPWDESAAWFAGPTALDAPLRPPVRTSVSFSATGYHILRGHDPSCYGAFRCGSLRDRFSQIDMLHLDVWWRGLNVLVDAGSYMYNGPAVWHNHFFRTSSHNTVEIDGRDQMLHFRKFKVLYLTEAKTLHFEDGQEWALCEGEHYGYLRAPLRSVHRRAVLFVKDDLWIVVDRIIGRSPGSLRLHWLCEAFPYEYDGATNRLTLSTPAGPFSVSVLNESGQPMPGEVVAGRADPPRGWLSRYYAEKTSVPSFSVNLTATAPVTLISILSGTPYDIEMTSGTWVVRQPLSQLSFRLTDGRFTAIRCDARP